MAQFDSDRRIDRLTRRERVVRARPRDDDFRETLATPVRTYRSDYYADDVYPSAAELVVRYLSGILGTLLALRFVASLFTADTSNVFVGFIYELTNWAVRPFQALFSMPPTGTTTGFFDLPTLAAMLMLWLLTGILMRLIRAPRV